VWPSVPLINTADGSRTRLSLSRKTQWPRAPVGLHNISTDWRAKMDGISCLEYQAVTKHWRTALIPKKLPEQFSTDECINLSLFIEGVPIAEFISRLIVRKYATIRLRIMDQRRSDLSLLLVALSRPSSGDVKQNHRKSQNNQNPDGVSILSKRNYCYRVH
jgi:hypothetical protein